MSTRSYHTPRPRKQQSGPGLLFWIIVIGGTIALLAAGIALVSGGAATARSQSAAVDPADLATEAPFVAVHEMGEGATIPFLPEGGPQPSVALNRGFHDFGRIGLTDVVEQTFVLRNDGEAPLTISRAYTTCGCTKAEFSASEIAPGKAATIRVVYDAGFHDAAGQTVRRGVIIEANDPAQPLTEIWVQATVADR
jgi:hypothetical protein